MTPLVAITPDLMTINGVDRVVAARAYAAAVERAGGEPVVVHPSAARAGAIAARFDAFIFTGGDDPRTEPFGAPTHAAAVPVHEDRQAFETALLGALAAGHPGKPVLGVCLGMQMMALVAGGRLNQHLPDDTPTHAVHWDAEHAVESIQPSAVRGGVVRSKHRQAVADAGLLRVVARAADGVVEAVDDPARRFYVGVQWHPERTAEPACGDALFNALVSAAR